MKRKEVTTKISKWGNGYGIRFPVSLLGELSLSNGAIVMLCNEGNKISIKPVKKSIKDMSVKEIFANSNSTNSERQEEEGFFGNKSGREIW